MDNFSPLRFKWSPWHRNGVELSEMDMGLENELYERGVSYMMGWKVTDRNMVTRVLNKAKLNNLSLLLVVSYIVFMMGEWVETLV